MDILFVLFYYVDVQGKFEGREQVLAGKFDIGSFGTARNGKERCCMDICVVLLYYVAVEGFGGGR